MSPPWECLSTLSGVIIITIIIIMIVVVVVIIMIVIIIAIMIMIETTVIARPPYRESIEVGIQGG